MLATCEVNVDKICGQRLVITNVSEHRRIERKARRLRRNRNTRQRHQREQTSGLQNDSLAAGVCSGDHHRILLFVERKRDRNDRSSSRSQVLFEQRMSSFDQFQFTARKRSLLGLFVFQELRN